MKLINCAADCSIKAFIACKFDTRLNVLIIEGKPTNAELREAFESIETEFNDLTGNLPAALTTINKINELTARNMAVHWCFFAVDEALRRANIPMLDALPRLKKLGINIKWKDDIEDYKRQVVNAKIREKTYHVRLEEMSKELETLQKSVTTSEKFNRQSFSRLKLAIQSLMGFPISETETNMFDFGVMCQDYFEAVKKQSPN